MPTPFSPAALKAEIAADPLSLGYSAHVAAGNHTAIAGLLNAANYSAWRPIPVAAVLKWGAANGVVYNIDAAAAGSGAYAPGGAHPITPADQSIAKAVQYLLEGGAYSALDITDPAIAGAVAGGGAYTPGATPATPGMLDALVDAKVLVDASGAPLKDGLLGVGAAAASRATVLWGYSADSNPTGPLAMTITTDQIAAALGS